MTAGHARRIVIIGGGFAGAVTALKLIEHARGPLELAMIEPAARLGRGIAYASADPDHVVNGVAGSFGLHPEQPELFLRWLEQRAAQGAWSPPPDLPLAAASPPRRLYGDYVEAALRAAADRASGRLRFAHVRERAVDIDGADVVLASGRRLTADAIVLATGLFRRDPALGTGLAAGHPAYVRDVFDAGALQGAERASHALLLGAGLTMLDALIGLEKRGFRGRYTVISRRGLLVEQRRDAAPWPGTVEARALPATARDVLRWIQRERRAVRAAGEDWQRLPPLFREHTSAIWAGLGAGERARLLKRLVPFWNLSQHRASPASFHWFERVRAEGRLVSLAGTVTGLDAANGAVRATVRPRGRRETQSLTADLVLSGLGYEFDWTRIDDPLVRNLVARGLAVPHPLRLGVRADPDSLGLVDRGGRTSPHLFAVGHPLRGELWEASSIREQLDQAIQLAAHLSRRATAVPEGQVA